MTKDEKFGKPPVDTSMVTKEKLQQIDNMVKIPIGDLVTPNHLIQQQQNVQSVGTHLLEIARKQADVVQDGINIYKLLPDLEIAKQTLISNILSPTDLKAPDLSISIHKEAPPEMADMIKDHFSTDNGFNLNAIQEQIIEEALITKGSYCVLPIPPSAIRKMIHENTYGLESNGHFIDIRPSLHNLPLYGFIGLPNGYGVKQKQINVIKSFALENILTDTVEAIHTTLSEDIKASEEYKNTYNSIATGVKNAINEIKKDVIPVPNTSYIEITDNPAYLIQGELMSNIKEYNNCYMEDTAWGLEAKVKEQTLNGMYRDRTVKMMPFLELFFDKNNNDDQDPVVLTLPQESVIPILNPSTKKPVAFYVLIDAISGNPLTLQNFTNKYKQLNDTLDRASQGQGATVSYSFGVSYPSTNNATQVLNRTNSDILLAAFEERFEAELRECIKNGKNGLVVEIAKVPEIARMMFARQLSKQHTRILYVQASKMVYVSYYQNQDGVGEGLIERTKLQSCLRSVLQFATIMNAINSAINRTKVTLNLDEKELDPKKTVELVRNEMAALASGGFPINSLNQADIVDSLLKAGYQFQVNGPQYPSTNVEIIDSKREVSAPPTDIQETLKSEQYQGWGLSLDLLEKANDIDFMGVIDNINTLQAKRMIGKQVITERADEDIIKTYLRCRGKFYNTLKVCLEKNKSTLTMDEFIDNIKVILPKADSAQHKAQLQGFTDYTTFVTTLIDAMINENEFSSLFKGENINGNIAGVKQILINELQRRYLKSRNIVPEMFDLLADPDKTLKGIIDTHMKDTTTLIGDLIMYAAKVESDEDKKIQANADKINPPEPEPTDDTGTEEGGDSLDDSGDTTDDDDDTGDDSLDFDTTNDDSEPSNDTSDSDETTPEEDTDTGDDDTEEDTDNNDDTKDDKKDDDTKDKSTDHPIFSKK